MWLETDGNGWTWLEMVGNGRKWPEIPEIGKWRYILSKFQLPRSNGVGMESVKEFKGRSSVNELITALFVEPLQRLHRVFESCAACLS